MGGKRNDQTGFYSSGLLNLPDANESMKFLKSEIRIKDGKIKNPKKRKMY